MVCLSFTLCLSSDFDESPVPHHKAELDLLLGVGTRSSPAASGDDSHGPGTVKIWDQSKQPWDFCLNDLLRKGTDQVVEKVKPSYRVEIMEQFWDTHV